MREAVIVSAVRTRVTSSCVTRTSVVTDSLKPASAVRTENVPSGTFEKVAVPVSFDVPERVQFVSVCVMVTSAPGTADPV